MASSGMLQINRYKYEKNPIDNVLASNEDMTTDDCFPFVVTHVALAFTSLPRMLASNTFALNEMRNQNAISESKLFRTDELLKQ
ncbi:hypothetical protein T09_6024 [Trichinella sp. T9]|nr:hypothetical protein T09_6024 [Trichinella sp. T9]